MSVLNIPGTDETIVLLEPSEGPKVVQNLIRVSPDGKVVWRAELPGSEPDSYTEIQLQGNGVVANTWTGYRRLINIESGKIISEVFVK